jgi:catechol 2,3-dioxygenase-like lactoylglutathione lyase family enzyme
VRARRQGTVRIRFSQEPTFMTVKQITPILFASDFPATVAYFTEKLGFAKLWDWGTPPDFGAVGRDEVEIFLSQGGQGAPGTWLSVFVEDVDALHDEVRARGAAIRSAPDTKPWGVREMHVELPDGHVLRFGHHVPCAEPMAVTRRDVPARLETRLASVLEDLALETKRTVGEVLEEVLLHSFEPVKGQEGQAAASPHTRRTLQLVEALKKKHGLDYDTHASYGFEEKG